MGRFMRILLVFFLTGQLCVFSQPSSPQTLLVRADKNREQIQINPEQAYEEAQLIEQQARIENNHLAEFRAILNQYGYFKRKADFENMMIVAKSLFLRAKEYNDLNYQAIAKIRMFDVYSFNQLYEKAYEQLQDGEKILQAANSKDSITVVTKSNIYIAYSFYYSVKHQFKKQTDYIKLSMQEHEKFKDKSYKQKLKYINYGNLAAAYENFDLDEAKYYAELSLSLDRDYDRGDVQFLDYFTLGKIWQTKKEYQKALDNFLMAEKIKNRNNHFNQLILYESIKGVYKSMGNKQMLQVYDRKHDSLKLTVAENQNKSLQQMLKDTSYNKVSSNSSYKSIWLFVVIVTVLTFLIFIFFRKNKKADSERHSATNSYEEQNEQEYTKLVKMFKDNDLAFMALFDEIYPDFCKKLLDINPNLVQSEMEFCALIKLKIPTKDIGRYRHLAHRTVQNKKYLIRKRLNISKGVDIYQWFSDL